MVIFHPNVNHINEFMMDSFNESINEYVQFFSVLIPKAANISRYNPQKQNAFGVLKKC